MGDKPRERWEHDLKVKQVSRGREPEYEVKGSTTVYELDDEPDRPEPPVEPPIEPPPVEPPPGGELLYACDWTHAEGASEEAATNGGQLRPVTASAGFPPLIDVREEDANRRVQFTNDPSQYAAVEEADFWKWELGGSRRLTYGFKHLRSVSGNHWGQEPIGGGNNCFWTGQSRFGGEDCHYIAVDGWEQGEDNWRLDNGSSRAMYAFSPRLELNRWYFMDMEIQPLRPYVPGSLEIDVWIWPKVLDSSAHVVATASEYVTRTRGERTLTQEYEEGHFWRMGTTSAHRLGGFSLGTVTPGGDSGGAMWELLAPLRLYRV